MKDHHYQKRLKMRAKFIIVVLLYTTSLWAQHPNEFTVVLQNSRYEANTIKKIEDIVDRNKYYFIGSYYIDKDNEGVINLKDLKKGLNKNVPKNTVGFLILDIENKLYHDLKKDNASLDFKIAEQAFIGMINFVRRHRPNIQISVYGIPFTTYWDEIKIAKYDNIVKKLDFISPHLYMYYPNKQFGKERNVAYLKKNLSLFLDYKNRLGIDVYPFIWYRIHPSNKKYKNKILSSVEINDYLDIIKDEDVENCKVDGVLWWEPQLKKPFDIDKKLINTFVED